MQTQFTKLKTNDQRMKGWVKNCNLFREWKSIQNENNWSIYNDRTHTDLQMVNEILKLQHKKALVHKIHSNTIYYF